MAEAAFQYLPNTYLRAGLKSTADPPDTANTDRNAKKHTESFSHSKLTIKVCNTQNEENPLQ